MTQRILLPAILYFCFSYGLNAQISLGVSGGANLTFRQWIIQPLDFDLGYKPALAWNTALRAEWPANKNFALQGEAGFQSWRSSLDVEMDGIDSVSVSGDMFEKFNSCFGSLLLKVMPLRGHRVYLLTGLSVAHILNGSRQLSKDFSGLEIPPARKLDLDQEAINRTHYFANLGAGMTFNCGAKGKLFAETRYQFGLNKFSSASTVTAKIQTLSINLGYLYQL